MAEFIGAILALGVGLELIVMGLRARRQQEEVRKRVVQRLMAY